jgi:hypothetical protein
MTDPKRITLPGPGSQPSHPAPEPPSDSHATEVLGTLPSGAPVERSLPPAEEQDERPGFNPFKFQRITVPPGLRANMIRWSREGKAEQLPTQTLPPGDVDESGLESASAESDDGEIGDGDDPGSMTPVGGSSAPKLPLRSVRGVALAAGLVILPLAVLGLASALRRQPSANVVDAAQPAFGTHTETVPPTPRVITPAAPAERTTATPAAASTVQALAPATTVAPLSTTSPSAKPARADTTIAPPPAKRTEATIAPPPAKPARPLASAAAPTAGPNENALDRPFSLPK